MPQTVVEVVVVVLVVLLVVVLVDLPLAVTYTKNGPRLVLVP